MGPSLDLALVAHGGGIGVALVVVLTLVIAAAARAWRRRARTRALDAALGPCDAITDAAVGSTVTLEGRIEGSERVSRLAGTGQALATTLRVAAPEGEVVKTRSAARTLVVGGRVVGLPSTIEVRAEDEARVLSKASRARVAREGVDLEAPLAEHVVLAGATVRARGRLARDDEGYREGGLVLVADERPVRVTLTQPSWRRDALQTGGAALVVLAVLCGAGHLITRALGEHVRHALDPLPGDPEPPPALPLTWAHRVALLGHAPSRALVLFDRFLARDETTAELLTLAAEAHVRRGDCAGAIEVLATHGAYEEGRALSARCAPSAHVRRARAVLERMDGQPAAGLTWLGDGPGDDRLRALLAIEADRESDAVPALERAVGASGSDERARLGLGCLVHAVGDTEADRRAGTRTCRLLALERDDATPERWWSSGLDAQRWLGASAAYASHPDAPVLTLGPPSTWNASDGAVWGDWPRDDGLTRAAERALTERAARASAEAEPRALLVARCALALSRDLHAYRRTGRMPEREQACPEDERWALARVDGVEVAVEALPAYHAVTDLVSFEENPTLDALRALVQARRRPYEIAWRGERELSGRAWHADFAREEAQPGHEEAPAPPSSALERAAMSGDARALHHLVRSRVAVRVGRTHLDTVRAWHRHRLRAWGDEHVGARHLTAEAYEDLWLARTSEATDAGAEARARVERLEAIVADRRRVILLDAFALALARD